MITVIASISSEGEINSGRGSHSGNRGGEAGRPTAATMEVEAATGAAGRRRRAGGRKGPVIKHALSRASRSSLLNEGFFGGRPRQPLKFTDLPPTVWPVAAEPPAVEESIKEEGRECTSEMNNRVNKRWSESSGVSLASRRPLQ